MTPSLYFKYSEAILKVCVHIYYPGDLNGGPGPTMGSQLTSKGASKELMMTKI